MEIGTKISMFGNPTAVRDVREQTKARTTLASIENATYYVFIWNSSTALASAIWRRTVESLIEAGVAGGAAKQGTLWGPVQRNCSAIFVPKERLAPG